LGGRVFVHALDLESAYGVAYHHPFRAIQLQNAVDWLAWGQAPLLVRGEGVYPMAFRRDGGDGVLLGMFNLSLDSWTKLAFIVGDCRAIGRIDRLTSEGRWIQDPAIRVTRGQTHVQTIDVDRTIPFNEPLFLWGTWQA
jgi:hypothetical protein